MTVFAILLAGVIVGGCILIRPRRSPQRAADEPEDLTQYLTPEDIEALGLDALSLMRHDPVAEAIERHKPKVEDAVTKAEAKRAKDAAWWERDKARKVDKIVRRYIKKGRKTHYVGWGFRYNTKTQIEELAGTLHARGFDFVISPREDSMCDWAITLEAYKGVEL